MYSFGKRSRSELDTCHPDLVKVMELAIRITNVDFGIHEGARTVEQQQKYFDEGKSKINPKKYSSPVVLAEVAKHIVIPEEDLYAKSRACDIHVAESHNGKKLTWDDNHFCALYGFIVGAAKMLYDQGQIAHKVRWGGDWNSNGVIALDHKFKDFPHFELYKP